MFLPINLIRDSKPRIFCIVNQAKTYEELAYSNHHIFTIDDLKDIRKRFNEMAADNKMIVTTEKDAVRLIKFQTELLDIPVYVLPVQHRFLFGDAMNFEGLVTNFINKFSAIKS